MHLFSSVCEINMKIINQILRFISPINFFHYIQLQRRRNSYCYTLSKVTRIESIIDLRIKIDNLDDQMRRIYFN